MKVEVKEIDDLGYLLPLINLVNVKTLVDNDLLKLCDYGAVVHAVKFRKFDLEIECKTQFRFCSKSKADFGLPFAKMCQN